MYFLQVNGIAASRTMSRVRALQAAAVGHTSRPDAIVWLMREDRKSGRSVAVERLY